MSKTNNKCFVLVSTKEKLWKQRAHNMEIRVGSPRFFHEHPSLCEEFYVGVSPRTVLDGCEDRFQRWWKLRIALLGCKYVYAVGQWEDDKECIRLMRFARWTFKNVYKEGEPL